jgi:autotransporter adhesin
MGNGAVAIGDPNVATGTGAVALGADNTATGNGAVALGNQSSALGTGAFAVGNLANANSNGAIALGNSAQATVDNAVALGAGSVASRAGMNGAAEAVSGVAVASTQGAVSVGSAGNERQITHVAGGTQDTDAVNLRQLRAAQASAVQEASAVLDGKINQIAQGVQRVERNASAGTAAAMAMAAMPQSTVPGRGMLSAGTGGYGGQVAIAIGASMLSQSGRWIGKLNASANSQGRVGVSVGAGFQW